MVSTVVDECAVSSIVAAVACATACSAAAAACADSSTFVNALVGPRRKSESAH